MSLTWELHRFIDDATLDGGQSVKLRVCLTNIYLVEIGRGKSLR